MENSHLNIIPIIILSLNSFLPSSVKYDVDPFSCLCHKFYTLLCQHIDYTRAKKLIYRRGFFLRWVSLWWEEHARVVSCEHFFKWFFSPEVIAEFLLFISACISCWSIQSAQSGPELSEECQPNWLNGCDRCVSRSNRERWAGSSRRLNSSKQCSWRIGWSSWERQSRCLWWDKNV